MRIFFLALTLSLAGTALAQRQAEDTRVEAARLEAIEILTQSYEARPLNSISNTIRKLRRLRFTMSARCQDGQLLSMEFDRPKVCPEFLSAPPDIQAWCILAYALNGESSHEIDRIYDAAGRSLPRGRHFIRRNP